MKIRTDFVTNSFSNSFIFRENDLKKKESVVLQSVRVKVSEDKFWRSDENGIVDEARYICNGLKRICELIPCEMQEVYDWYKWQILGDLTEKNACDFSEEELRFAALDMVLGINLLAQQQRRMDHFCLMTEKEQAEKRGKGLSDGGGVG